MRVLRGISLRKFEEGTRAETLCWNLVGEAVGALMGTLRGKTSGNLKTLCERLNGAQAATNDTPQLSPI